MIDWMRNFIDNYTHGMYFPKIQVMDIIEILIITVIVYEIMLWIKNTKAWMLLRGIIMLGVFILLAWIFQMHTILFLAAQSINVLAIAAVVVFQPELRRALEKLGEKIYSTALIRLIKTEITSASRMRQRTALSGHAMKWAVYVRGPLSW